MKSVEKKFFIGIDLGGKEKKTTGVCILEKRVQKIIFEENYCKNCKEVFGKDIIRVIRPYLKETAVIAIDAPLTKGRGKGKMRLYEKFLSTSIFRKEKVNPIPPALMQKWCDFAREIRQKLEKRGFVLDLNLIEAFPTLIEKMSGENLFSAVFGKKFQDNCQNKNQKSALICAILAYLHLNFKTRYLGYKDGFLFLPEMSFWKKGWRQKFYQAWMARPRLKYHHLITNVFVK
jgi:predicted nuclease with RNAse H fold